MGVDGAEDADRHALAMLAAPDDDNVDAVTTAQRLDSASRERSALERSAGDALLENEHMYEPAGSSFRIERVFESISRERRQVLAEIEAQRQAQRRAKERKKSRFADVKRPARGSGGNVLTSGGSKSNNSTAGALPEDADDADDADDTSASDYINMMLMQPDHLVFNKYTRFFLDEELESLYQEYTARNWFNRARGHMAFWMCFHVLVYVLYFILPGSGFRGMAQFDRNYESFLEWLQWAYLFMAVPFAAMPADRNPCQSHWRAIVCTIVILFNFGLQMWIGAACDSAVKKFQQTVDDTLVCPKDGQNDTSSTQKDMVSLTVHLYTGALVQILAVFSSIFSFIFVISVRLEFVQVMLVGVGTIISYILVLGLYQLQVEWMTAYAYGVSIVLLFVLSYSSDRTNRRSFLTNFQVEKENESLKSSLNKAEAALMNDAACDSEKRAVATILGVSDTRHLEMIRIPFADLKFLQAIGRGAMGDVIKAKYFGTDVRPTFATVLRRLQGSVQQEIQGDAEKSTLERRARTHFADIVARSPGMKSVQVRPLASRRTNADTGLSTDSGKTYTEVSSRGQRSTKETGGRSTGKSTEGRRSVAVNRGRSRGWRPNVVNLSLSQWLHLLHRFMILACAIVYVFTCIGSVIATFLIMTDSATPTMTFSPYTSIRMGELVGGSSIYASPLMELVGGDSRARNDTLYVSTDDYASFEKCPQRTPIDDAYTNAFLRSIHAALVRDTSYNLTFLHPNNTELIAPAIDCTCSSLLYADSTASMYFYLLRNLKASSSSDEVMLLVVTISNQGYKVETRGETGPASVVTLAVMSDVTSGPLKHHFALALGYPFQRLSYQVYEKVALTSDGFWCLRSVPVDPTAEVPRALLTSCRTGFYWTSEAEQSNIKNEYWALEEDPVATVSQMLWQGGTVLRDSWAWVHMLHIVLAGEVFVQLLVLVIVIYRNWQMGKLWIGDAFVAISSTLLFRGLIVFLSWVLDGFWALSEFCYHDGNEVSQVEQVYVREPIIHADFMVLYLTCVAILGKVFHERIDPALTMILFKLGFYNRIAILQWFPRLVDIVSTKTLSDYQLGVVQTEEDIALLTPLRLWNIHVMPNHDVVFMLAVIISVFSTLLFVIIYVAAAKFYRWREQKRAVLREEANAVLPKPLRSENITSLSHKSFAGRVIRLGSNVPTFRTQFETATGASLENQFGVIASYENHRVIKGLRYASADGVYSSGFVIANAHYLLATDDVLSILLIKLTRVRFRNVYVYDVDGYHVQQMARLVYPETLTVNDLVNLNITILTYIGPFHERACCAVAWSLVRPVTGSTWRSSSGVKRIRNGSTGVSARSQGRSTVSQRCLVRWRHLSFFPPFVETVATRVVMSTPKLVHRSSDPKLGEVDLYDTADMGEHALWSNLDDRIYSERDIEIYRCVRKDSTLPVYYIKGWMPCAADTLFNTLMDSAYRKSWDTYTKQVYALERVQDVVDVMYFGALLPWPFATRDYVYHRRMKFFPKQNSFVVLSRAAHHASAPECNGMIRVETFASRMCIRSTGTNSCDLYIEYEDDTNFSIPNCIVNLLLNTYVPSFMHELKTACTNYAAYTKTLDDNGVHTIPSLLMRRRSADEALSPTSARHASGRSTAVAMTNGATPTSTVPLSLKSPLANKKSSRPKLAPGSAPNLTQAPQSDDLPTKKSRTLLRRSTADDHGSSSSGGSSTPRRRLKKTSSMSRFFSKASSARAASSADDNELDDDFVVEFHKQKIGLHLETELFSTKVLVAFCEKGSEAAKCSVCLEPGLLLTSVNGVPVADMGFKEVLHEIKKSARPIKLGFTHPDKDFSRRYRRFKEPKNVLKVVVSRDAYDLVPVLRALDEDAGTGAVLKTDFVAPIYKKKKQMTQQWPPSGSLSPTKCVVVPEGFLVYEIDDCHVLDLPFAEVMHLLRRNSNPKAVTFKAAMAIVGDQVLEQASRSALSKRLSGVFKWRGHSMDELCMPYHSPSSQGSQSSYAELRNEDSPPKSARAQSNRPQQAAPASAPAASSPASAPVPASVAAAAPAEGLSNYSNVVISAKNIAWAWQHVQLLRTDERLFSAALLIEKIEAFLMNAGSDENSTIKSVLSGMTEQRDALNKIKTRSNLGVQALHEFNSEEQAEWRFAQTYFGVSTHWKPGSDGTVWLKLDGIIEGVDIFNTIGVIYEIDLYHHWVPFCNRAELLRQTSHVEITAYLSIALPLLSRDAVIHAFGINACYEHRCILLLGGSTDQANLPPGVTVPKLKGWNSDRMEIRGFRALIEPLSPTKARKCIVANIDPKCPIPKSLLNFGIKKMAGILLYLIMKEAEKIEAAQRDGKGDNEHLRRMQADPTGFYAWLRPRLVRWFDDKAKNQLPAPLSVITTPTLESHETSKSKPSLSNGQSSPSRSPTRTGAHSHSHSQPPSPTRFKSMQWNTGKTSHSHATAPTSDDSALGGRMLVDYLYDFGIWPYFLLFIFARVTPEDSFLFVCALKFVFTCTCTWFGVPGAYSWQTRQRKRATNELDVIRRRAVVVAGVLDVLNSWFLRVWVHWLVCFMLQVLPVWCSASVMPCHARSARDLRESENFWLMTSAFSFATVVVGIQIVNTPASTHHVGRQQAEITAVDQQRWSRDG
ncbi:TPA: hypothetical protein N0F65_001408 [Lagenidium giganteum]|uniref:Phosphatidylcholine transfer protein n=1 Tax=Lagenidium giganteum TaxID=4803 RepID=A0AAV2YZT0_9STRA|nr:TPA: hypothetical protein N0F65_001408 [Lagenidium giganteum]